MSTTLATEAQVNPDADGLVGGGMDWFSDTLPSAKWRFRDGALLSRSEFSLLFSRIGTTYNTGGEAGTEFRLPNDAGRVTVGFDQADTDFDTLGETGGSKAASMPTHRHSDGTLSSAAHFHDFDGGTVIASAVSIAPVQPGGATNYNVGAGQYSTTGFDGPHDVTGETADAICTGNNLPPYIVIRPIIKVM